MIRLLCEYIVVGTRTTFTTTQHFKTVEKAIKFIETRPGNYPHLMSTFEDQVTRYGQCDLMVKVDGDLTAKNYYIFRETGTGRK